ncbi:hypothetical protein GN244_ATG03924 [Phytophthora infestans]|uniref:Uncharacterized protein n=1 Tax=Phytophthora infestans TaxID=4787 RepID=A0A833WK25_PHYIN|nr:hypothetical protein GN244_ATG03924 [Phytophthora infestans]KAF4150134.1 hypothetical protein GN958_ATG00760 [Phytophthora infestans]
MERNDRKRKAQEISESPEFVSETINELTSVLSERDSILRTEITELRDEVGRLEKQLSERVEECNRLEADVAFYHPDAIVDRIRMKYWYNGDLTILRKAINPQSRVLRSTDTRGERFLFLSDVAAKKRSASTAKTAELSPKHEGDEATTSLPAIILANSNKSTGDTEEELQEDECVSLPPNANEVTLSPQKEATSDAVAEPAPEADIVSGAPALGCSA